MCSFWVNTKRKAQIGLACVLYFFFFKIKCKFKGKFLSQASQPVVSTHRLRGHPPFFGNLTPKVLHFLTYKFLTMVLWHPQEPAWCAFFTLCHLPFPSCQPLSPAHASLCNLTSMRPTSSPGAPATFTPQLSPNLFPHQSPPQWFSANHLRDSCQSHQSVFTDSPLYPMVTPTPRGHAAVSGDINWCHNWGAQQRIIWPQMSVVPKLRNTVFIFVKKL